MRRLTLIISILMLAGLSTAQPVDQNTDMDTVIVASTANFPDAFMSKPVSEDLGTPILLTEKDQLSESASSALENFNVKEAVIVGGPTVISESVEEQIEEQANTTRLWGTTQIGTSVEVSQYFFTESEEVTIVQYPQDTESYRFLAEISKDVEDQPLLISTEGTLSTPVLTEVERLNATEVKVHSDSPANVTQDLEQVGVEEVEIESLEREQEDRNESVSLFVAASGFKDALTAASARGRAHLVRSEDEIEDAADAAVQSDEDTLYVTGNPELAGQIAETLRDRTDKEIVLLSGQPEEVSANFTSRNAPEWAQEQEQELQRWRDRIRQSGGIQNAANKTIKNAEGVIDENSSEEARELLEEAISEYEDGDYFEARNLATRAHSTARSQEFQGMNREEIRERVEEEREDLNEAVKELRELGQEQAEELREAETTEERLEIIREYRGERREELEELREERREREREGVERRERNESTGERFRQEAGDAEDIGNSELKIEVRGNEVKARGLYTASTAGYTPATDLSQNDSTVSFEVELNSPEGASAQVVSDYRVERRIDLENGSYTVEATFRVDGEVQHSITREIQVPSNSDFEKDSETENESETESGEDNTVTYTDSGFQPQQITVQEGEEVTWIDESGNSMWVASNVHPSHREYDGTSASQHCEDGESNTFDQCSEGGEYEFEFHKTGEWDYHNHLSAQHTGTVVVE